MRTEYKKYLIYTCSIIRNILCFNMNIKLYYRCYQIIEAQVIAVINNVMLEYVDFITFDLFDKFTSINMDN